MADGHDAWAPGEIARRVDEVGVAKARADALTTLTLAVLAGAFISLGAMFCTVVLADGGSRLAGGLVFCLGLILVVVAGAELFTGNNLIAMAWASKHIRTRDVLRNWLLVYVGNVVGCLGTAMLVWVAGTQTLLEGAVGAKAIAIAGSKAQLGWGVAFARGILCNALVCLAVWLCLGGRSVTDKILAILFPITAFVVLGFEHSIANWYFLSYAMLVLHEMDATFVEGAARNLVAVTAGNIVGGTMLVAGVYWLAYLRNEA
ncbi:MAG: formate/nitrite transporter family protein [Planctomycetota bacterium]